MSEHQSFAKAATRLIKKHGRTVTLVSFKVFGDKWDPKRSKQCDDIKAVSISFTKAQLAGNLVQSGDTRYLIDSVIKPSLEMKIIDDKERSIVDIEEVRPGDQSILFKVHCRG